MIIHTLEPLPDEIKRKRDVWSAEKDKWWNKVKKEEEYYYSDVDGTGTNFSYEQLKRIKEEGSGVPVSVNYIHPIVNQKLAILTKNTPSFKVTALDDRGKEISYVLDKIIKHLMYKSEALGEEEECIKNMLILGIGISSIEEIPYSRVGEFPIKYKNLHPTEIILDANSKQRSMQDATGYFIEKEITKEVFEYTYSNLLKEINERRFRDGLKELTFEDIKGNPTHSLKERQRVKSDFHNNTVVVTEYYDKVLTNLYFTENVEDGTITPVFIENVDEDLQPIVIEMAKEVEENIFVRKTVCWNDKIVLIEMLPITEFKIKAKFFEWGGTPYKSYGMIHFIREMQEVSDKVLQQLIVNAVLTNNAGYIAPEGAITSENRNNWMTLGNVPGAVKEYKIVNIEGNILRPEREQIQQLPPIYFNILEYMRLGMEYSTGINPIVSGNPNQAKIEVFSTAQQYHNAAMERILLASNHINLANESLGNVMIQYLLNTLRLNQVYVYLDEKNQINEVRVTQEMLNNALLSKFLLISVQSDLLPSQRVSQSIELFKVAQTTSDPYHREAYMKKAFSLSNIRGYDEMAEEIDTINNLNQQIQQLSEQIDRDKELIKQYENRALLSEYNEKLAKLILNTLTSINKKLLSNEDIENLNTEKQQLMIDELQKLSDKLNKELRPEFDLE